MQDVVLRHTYNTPSICKILVLQHTCPIICLECDVLWIKYSCAIVVFCDWNVHQQASNADENFIPKYVNYVAKADKYIYITKIKLSLIQQSSLSYQCYVLAGLD